LENLCHWLTVMAPAPVVSPADLPPEVRGQEAVALEQPPALAQTGPSHAAAVVHGDWEPALAEETARLLRAGQEHLWSSLAQRFEAVLIRTALEASQGRRIEAAQRLGMGRNTLARKLQELRMENAGAATELAGDDQG